MEKKQLGIAIALGVILLVIIGSVFVYDTQINTSILEVNGQKYDVEDFKSYLKVWQYENGAEYPVDVDDMFEQYSIYKLYYQYVKKYKVALNEENAVAELTDTQKEELAQNYNLSDSEYMRVKQEIALVDYLYANLQDYFIVSEEEYNEHKTGNEDKFKTYDYRVMQVSVESAEETSGDSLSGDASGDVSGDNSEQARKDRAMSRAVEALAKVKSGDSFEEVASEYGSYRIVYNASGYNLVNGNLETVSGLYMNDFIFDQNVIDALTTLQVGEYSQIYDEESAYVFVYLEAVRDGLDEAEDNLYKREIGNSHIQGEARIIKGSAIALSSIDLEKLIPILAETSDDDETSGDIEEVSGESSESSGEAINQITSGEAQNSGESIENVEN